MSKESINATEATDVIDKQDDWIQKHFDVDINRKLNLSFLERRRYLLKTNAESIVTDLKKLEEIAPQKAYDELKKSFIEIGKRLKNMGGIESSEIDSAQIELDAKRLKALRYRAALILNDYELDELRGQEFDAEENGVSTSRLKSKIKKKLSGRRSNQKKLDKALRALADNVVAKVVSETEGADDIEKLSNYIVDCYLKGEVTLDVLAINSKAKSSSVDTTEFIAAKHATERLDEIYQERAKALGPSMAPRESISRTPSEVIVHFINAATKDSARRTDDTTVLDGLIERAKSMMKRHDLTVVSMKTFFGDASDQLKGEHDFDIMHRCVKLMNQLPDSDDDLLPTRLHENIYGRVYDSGIVTKLVENPPKGVSKAMEAATTQTLSWIENELPEKYHEDIAKDFQKYLTTDDVRFWFDEDQLPELMAVRDALTPAAAVEALKNYLRSPKETGLGCVSVPYVMVKLWNLMAQRKVPNWKIRGDSNYGRHVSPQTGRVNKPELGDAVQRVEKVKKPKSKGPGLVPRYMQNPFEEDWMTPSTRPSDTNMPNFKEPTGDDDPTYDPYPTEAVKTALKHGVPYASGVSGSTNIMLYLLSDLKAKDPTIDVKDYLLGTLMFLTYDGGHSIHEALWTANQVDNDLELGLGLSDPTDEPHQFVGDYERFIDLFDSDDDESTGAILKNAEAAAMDTVLKYFENNSYYSDTNQAKIEQPPDRSPLPNPTPEF